MPTRLPETETEKKFFEAVKNNNIQAAVSVILRAPDGKKMPIAELADEHGMTALHWATSNRNPAGMRWLLDKKTDVNLKDDQGRTPLKIALDHKDVRAMTMLLDSNAKAADALPGHDEELKGFKNTSDLVDFMIKTAAADAAKPPPPAVVAPTNDAITVTPAPVRIDTVAPALVRRMGPFM
jgi:ankyrin repeat protein